MGSAKLHGTFACGLLRQHYVLWEEYFALIKSTTIDTTTMYPLKEQTSFPLKQDQLYLLYAVLAPL